VSSSRVTAVIGRVVAARSSWSTRPNGYSILVRDVFAAGSHSRCTTAGRASSTRRRSSGPTCARTRHHTVRAAK
jgi:hypothetical protein